MIAPAGFVVLVIVCFENCSKLGFHELCRLSTFCRVVRPVHLLLRKTLRRAPALSSFRAFSSPDGTWSLSLRCPFSEEDLALINGRPGIHIQRSPAFYQWKVGYLPEGETAYLCARQGGRVTAFLVLCRLPEGSCLVCDWMLPDDKAASRRLLKEAVRLLRPYCDLLTVPMVNPLGEEPAQLSGGGFFQKKAWPLPFMIYPTAELDAETLSRLKDFRSWTLRYIDTDTILNG